MITPFSIIQALLAGFCFTSGIIIIIFIWARRQILPIWPLVIISLATTAFSISKMLLNSTSDLQEAIVYYRIMSFCIPIIIPAIPIFTKKVLSIKIDWKDFFIITICFFYSIGNLVFPLTLDYDSLSPMQEISLGFLGTIYSTVNWHASIIYKIMLIFNLSVFVYSFQLAYVSWRKGINYAILFMILSLGLILFLLYQLSIGLRIVHGPGFAEFIGFLLNICFIAAIFFREKGIIKAMHMREENLRKANRKIEAINSELTQANAVLQGEINIRAAVEKSLKESEERYHEITSSIPGFVYQYYQTNNGESGLIYVDNRSYEMFEIEIEPKNTWFDRFVNCLAPEDKQKLLDSMYKREEKIRWSFEGNFFKPSGKHLIIKAFSQLVIMEDRKLWNGLVLDITDQKKSEERLKKSEEIFSTIFHKSPLSMAIINLNNQKIMEVNQSWLDLTGFTKEECFNKKSAELGLWYSDEQQREFVNLLIKTGHVKNFEFLSKRKDGEILQIMMNSEMIVLDGEPAVLSISEDITRRKKDEEALKKSLTDKETLLRELYHRTKNNMQIICSLLQLQSSSLSNPNLVKILDETSNRIKTMALVHQKLYQSKDLSYIDLREYTIDLVYLLVKLFSVKTDRIEIKMDFDDIYILIDYGVTIGLIINEIVSNVFKYAFPKNKKGHFYIKMTRGSDNYITMIFEDNGVGLPQNLDMENPPTLGLQLIQSLVTDQLNGKLDIDRTSGLKYSITFTDNLYEKRV